DFLLKNSGRQTILRKFFNRLCRSILRGLRAQPAHQFLNTIRKTHLRLISEQLSSRRNVRKAVTNISATVLSSNLRTQVAAQRPSQFASYVADCDCLARTHVQGSSVRICKFHRQQVGLYYVVDAYE